jgi:hypothetical protein
VGNLTALQVGVETTLQAATSTVTPSLLLLLLVVKRV